MTTSTTVRPLLATAQHRAPWTDRPWGVLHAAVEGAAETLCGQPSLTWPKFWRLTFRPGARDTCGACSAALRRHAG
ncbi:hypothetical protein [Nocardioides jejuensis]|uniref:Uncharacterized protein n=1 Tax=Nocardioides jejuensis TaxID=2502782 RepID=A0A4R1BYN0_9ACTN|nr:hypothetical protein [Nocardioides jejuensis]TCJ23210.1 hypothetical protein EPD65_11575 [Nocardioides jejuensis]